jgi:large subunit ribosomal protein L4
MQKTAVKKNTAKVKKEPKAKNASASISDAVIYNQDGKSTGSLKLPETIFGVRWNADLVHQVAVSYAANKRLSVAHTKDRSEVRGGGKKPWQQKGTGRSRHGSSRSPIWRGGGITFGPRKERNFEQKINKKMRTKALFTVLSKKNRDGEIFFIDELNIKEGKTKNARLVLSNLSKTKGLETLLLKNNNSAVAYFADKNTESQRALRNFKNINVNEIRNINVLDILNARNILIVKPAESIKILESKI